MRLERYGVLRNNSSQEFIFPAAIVLARRLQGSNRRWNVVGLLFQIRRGDLISIEPPISQVALLLRLARLTLCFGR